MYTPQLEHDACGIGFVANIDHRRTHETVSDAILMLENMEHRGGVGAEPETGDGAGILTEIPYDYFDQQIPEHKKRLTPRSYGVGMMFLPKPHWEECLDQLSQITEELGFDMFHKREVPVNSLFVGPTARENEPIIMQIFLQHGDLVERELERKLYILNKYATQKITASFPDFYFSSLSCYKIVYKGQLRDPKTQATRSSLI